MRVQGRRLDKLERRIVSRVANLSTRTALIEADDRILVGVSGGKGSFALLDALVALKKHAPIPFDLLAMNLDQGYPEYRQEVVGTWLERQGVRSLLMRRDHCAVVQSRHPPGRTACSRCSRLRLSLMAQVAREQGCAKIALGHHLDDAVDILLLNLFYSGRLASMAPSSGRQGGDLTVIRPLLEVAEADIDVVAASRGYPVARCACPTKKGEEGRRPEVRALVDELERSHPRIRTSMRKALSNVKRAYLWTERRRAR